jgi:NAD(P)-dependent dehydrogenase (short-subunit alcohol dehydrogenase family)
VSAPSEGSAVVITGSSRGLGFAMAREFLRCDARVTISSHNEQHLAHATEALSGDRDRLLAVACDVREREQIEMLWTRSVERWGRVDIWINNAGINQPDEPIWQLSRADTDAVVGTNLLGMVYGSQVAVQGMLRQDAVQGLRGQLLNVEGLGSNGMHARGSGLYATTKSALTFFTRALAAEVGATGVLVGRLSPGMMITDFVVGPVGVDGEPRDYERARRVFNILGDRPETVAGYLVPRILRNRHNDAHIVWLTSLKAAWRFATAQLRQRDLFEG